MTVTFIVVSEQQARPGPGGGLPADKVAAEMMYTCIK